MDYSLVKGVAVIDKLSIDGQPVDPAKSYTVACQAYIMMHLMHYPPGPVTDLEYSSTSPREALVKYITDQKIVTAPAVGRIVRLVQPRTGKIGRGCRLEASVTITRRRRRREKRSRNVARKKWRRVQCAATFN